jgi:P27 family predicted phage terminase small subunit
MLADVRPPVPELPGRSGMLQATRDRWAAFWGSQVARAVNVDSDLPRLIRWARATDEYDRVAEVCKRSRLVKGSMGQPVLNPLFSYLAQLEAQIARAETEFGMTPMARLRLGIALGELKERQERAARAAVDDEGRRARVLAVRADA